MRYRSLIPGALALSMAWVSGCGENSTEPTPAEPTPSGPEWAVASNSWITRAALPTARTSLALATVTNAAGESVVYAIGGATTTYPVTPLRKVTAYNVATNAWTDRRPLPVPLAWSNGAGVINGKIYVSGGFSENGDAPPTRALYVYDPGTNTWARKRDLPAIVDASHDWTVGSYGVTGVIRNKLYVVTHCSSRMYYTENDICEGDLTGPRLFRYNPVTDRWATLAPPFDSEVTASAGGVIGGKFYVMGGDHHGNGRLSVYDPATNQWTPKTPLALARSQAATAVLGDKLYVMGGSRIRNNLWEVLDITIVYDPVTDLWTRRASLPSPRLGMEGTTVLRFGRPRIEVVGGDGPGGLAESNLQYVP